MKKLVTPDGMEHNLTDVDFKAPEEPWVEYKISDGTILKYRSSIMSIMKSDKYAENGNPFYFVDSQQQWRTYPPKELKGKPSERPHNHSVKPADTTSYR